MTTVYCYKKCSTCKKAEKFLTENHIAFELIDYTEVPLTVEQLRKAHTNSGLPLKRLFNTSGNVYKELDMKNRVETLSDEEAYTLLSKHPMLVKRPLVFAGSNVLIGFKIPEWEKQFLQK